MISRKVLFALQWTLATALAVVIANLIIEILFFAVMGWALLFLLPFVGGVMGGFPVGLFQWIVLRRFVSRSEPWIVATTLGFFAAWCVAAILLAIVLTVAKGAGNTAVFLALAAATPIIGFAQRRVIKTRFWVIASTVGWTSFVAVLTFGSNSLPAVSSLAARVVSAIAGYAMTSMAGAALLGGTLAGATTGIALASELE
jgi:hypothetical protein